MKDWKAAIIYSIAIVSVAFIAALTFFNRSKADDAIAVTGMGRMDFASDHITWTAAFSEQATALPKAYEKIEASRLKVLAFLREAGIKQSELTMASVSIDKLWTDVRNSEGNVVGRVFAGYELSQPFTVDSSEVEKVERASRDVTSLLKDGLELSSDSPDYFYTALADLKLQLIALATQDAQSRATQIASNSGATLGKLRYASLGVFQIIGLNASPEASWEGAFDTKSKMKTATITIRAQYEAK
jgi:hypothetical protein